MTNLLYLVDYKSKIILELEFIQDNIEKVCYQLNNKLWENGSTNNSWFYSFETLKHFKWTSKAFKVFYELYKGIGFYKFMDNHPYTILLKHLLKNSFNIIVDNKDLDFIPFEKIQIKIHQEYRLCYSYFSLKINYKENESPAPLIGIIDDKGEEIIFKFLENDGKVLKYASGETKRVFTHFLKTNIPLNIKTF